MSVSDSTLLALQRTDDPFGILYRLEISGGGLAEPVRLVADTRDLQSEGVTWLGLPFSVQMPRQEDKEIPRAQIVIDNVGSELTADLEAMPPTSELLATISVVHRKTPDVVDYQFKAPIGSVSANPLSVTASMGVADLWRRPAVNLRFDPITAPGLFPT